MNTNLPDSNFTLNSVNNNHTFTYTRDKYGPQFGFGIFLLICIIYGVSFLFTNALAEIGWIGFFVLSIGFPIIVIFGFNKYLRENGTFTVNSNEIIVDGKHYSREHIRRLTVITPKEQVARAKNVQGGTVILSGSAIPVAAATIGHQAVNAGSEILDNIIKVIGDGVREVNYKLSFQYGHKEIKLAGGMTEKNATYLFDYLINIMQ